MKELNIIQTQLNAPKNQRNNFGGYNYRSAEDILEALKPLLKETKCSLTISDDIVMVGERIYVKATATLKNATGEAETATAFAREEESKKGMDSSQLTGATSSYARKYALNGLFCIDDNKDFDTNQARVEMNARAESQPQPVKEFSLDGVKAATPDLQTAVKAIKSARSRKGLEDIYATYKSAFGTNPEFLSALAEMGKKYPKK